MIGSLEYLVRFQKRLARKRYLNSKRVYEYERISLHVPKKFHETIKPYLEEDLDLKVATEKGSLTLILTPLKTLRHAANNPAKTRQEGSEQT
jgi:CO dehydrogenase/acetyl-CoA synthase beta subunit